MTEFKITLAQLNPTVGDIDGNAVKARTARQRAKADGAEDAFVVLSELFIAGYQPEDLVKKPAFQSACRSAIEELARETADGGAAMLIGTPWVEDGKLYNAVALLDSGEVASLRFKANLPNYGVFDEKRLFARGSEVGPGRSPGQVLAQQCAHVGQPQRGVTAKAGLRQNVCELTAQLCGLPGVAGVHSCQLADTGGQRCHPFC